MPHIDGYSYEVKFSNNQSVSTSKNLEVEDIEFLFSTEQTEGNRTDFDSTFEEFEVYSKAVGGDVDNMDNDSQARAFYAGLTDN